MAVQILEIEMHTICAGQLAVNVLHFRRDEAMTDLFQIAKDAVDLILAGGGSGSFNAESYMEAMSENCFLSLVSAKVVGGTPGPRYPKIVAESAFPGQQVGEVYSQTVACNLKLITASGPDLTGRIFYPGVPEDALVRNRFTDAYAAIIGQLRSDIMAGFAVIGPNWLPVVYSLTVLGAEDVTNIMLVPNPATQRRRVSPI